MSGSIVLSDGRSVGYSEFGDSRGAPILYFHGYPGSRLEAAYLAGAAERQRSRLIGVDRPGMGLSSYQKKRHITDWPTDVAEIADRLRLGKFSVVGLSGGGPYALACAARLPGRLNACGVVSGSGPQAGIGSLLRGLLPWIMLPIMRAVLGDKPQALDVIQKVTSNWSARDQAAISQSNVREIMVDALLESFRQGTRGPARDGMLNDWGFHCEEISFENVFLWHGDKDSEVPVVHAQDVARRIGKCKSITYPDEGHISVIVNHSEEIVSSLVNQRA